MLKVFLAEDEIVIRDGIRKNVDWAGRGYDFCGEAADGELAIPMIRRLRPDIIITDIRMPFMDGLELAALVRKELPYSEIIILTGHEKFEYAKKGIEIGVSEYLLKPVSGDELLRAVDSAAERIRERQRSLELQERYTKRVAEAAEKTSESAEPRLDSFDLKNVDATKVDRNRIMDFLRQGTVEDVPEFVKTFFEEMSGPGNAMQSTIFRQYIIIDSYLCASKVCAELGASPEEAGPDVKSTPDIALSLEGAAEYITELFKKVISIRDSSVGSRHSDVMEKIISYIDENYANDTISLEEVASFAGFSPNHLSGVFKEETGKTFIRYLTDLRMNKAREYLRCTNKRSSEIAELVGYKDPHYFSYLFKKTQNMTPTEYRENKASAKE